MVGRERTKGSAPCGVSGAGASWLGWIRFPFPFLFFRFSVWRGWVARRPDALLAPDVQALAVVNEKTHLHIDMLTRKSYGLLYI